MSPKSITPFLTGSRKLLLLSYTKAAPIIKPGRLRDAGLHTFSSVNAIGILASKFVNSGDDPNRFEGLLSVHCVGFVPY